MSYSGGVFSRLYSWLSDKNNSIKINAARMNAEMDGMATGLSTCILKDGSQTITADIPFSSHKITGLGNATADGDALNRISGDGRFVQQVGGGAMTVATAVSASAIDLTASAYFTKTVSGDLTWTISGAPTTGSVFGFLLELTNGGTGTMTWPGAFKWPNGNAPSLTASGVDLLVGVTRDGGTTFRMSLAQRNSR